MISSLKSARARRSQPPPVHGGEPQSSRQQASDQRTTEPLPIQPPRHIPRVFPNRPPPEGAVLRDRATPEPEAFVHGSASEDTLAESMGEDAVRAMTTGQDEGPALAEGERLAELGGPFLETGPLTETGTPERLPSRATDRSRRA